MLPLLLLLSCSRSDEHTHADGPETYTCPMHPDVAQQGPGTCPVCGMDLVRQGGHGDHAEAIEITDDLRYLLEPATDAVVARISTVQPVSRAMRVSIEAPGIITYDTRRTFTIPARFGGRIEQLNIRYNFQPVRKGEKIMEVYSPELVTAQREYLFLLESDPHNTQLINAARQKLQLLGVNDAQINQLARTRKPQYALAIYSPYNGYVTEAGSPQGPPPIQATGTAGGGGGMGAMGGGGGMGASPSPAQAAPAGGAQAGTNISLREGMYVSTGQPLFRVVNAEQLWAEFDIPAAQATQISQGDPIRITMVQNDFSYLGSVNLVQPFFNEGGNFVKLRASVPAGNGQLQVGQLVQGTLTDRTEPALWIPRESVWDLGTRHIAFLQQGGVFRPVEINTGRRSGNMVEVTSGLTQASVIASNAQFLMDSESFIRVNPGTN